VIIEVDPASPVPPYEQLRGQIATMIESGMLSSGHRLPSVRQLASDLGLANGTVARAYRELEAAELVATAGRNGTVVAADATITTAARTSRLRDAADAFVRLTRQLGAADQETHAALARAGLRPTTHVAAPRASE
jgi:DNA-binding transcriptional regulator YhcF (GntR family)